VKRSPLKRNPEKQRAWQDRSREKALGRGKTVSELAVRASSELLPGPARGRPKRGKPRVVIPPSVRQAARARSEGRCVMCLWLGRPPKKIAHLHHVLPKGLARFSKWAAESANLVGLCFDCHAAHTDACVERTEDGGLRSRRIPWEALPDVTVQFVARCGGPAVDYCERTYPRATETNAA
jgi:5-methylcytosine-specific restriction endonuclease McrA